MKRRQLVFGGGLAISTLLSGCMSQTPWNATNNANVNNSTDETTEGFNNPNISTQTKPNAESPINTSDSRTTQSTTGTPTKREVTGLITADTADINDNVPNYFNWYGPESASLKIKTDHLSTENIPKNSQILILIQKYPNGELVGISRSATFETPNEETIQIEYPQPTMPRDEYFSITAALVPSNVSTRSLQANQITHLTETDRLSTQDGKLVKAPHPKSQQTMETDTYTRKTGEGTYVIQTTSDHLINILVYKAAYINAKQSNTTNISDVITQAYNSGISSKISDITYQEAKSNGYSTQKETINYALQAIQELPYVRDGGNYDAYSKFPSETLVEAGGDCEDTTILLASILAGSNYKQKTSLIWLPAEQPTHIGLGIKGNDTFTGSYYQHNDDKYYYAETTGQNWKIGQIPEQFQTETARIEPLSFNTN